jgi:peptide/nickel transport system substrate-binding protein
MNRLVTALGAGLLTALLTVACSPSKPADKPSDKKPTDVKKPSKKPTGPKDPTKLTIGIAQEPDSLFIPFKEMMASEQVVRVTPYTLTIFDEDWKLKPWAAKEIPTVENGLLELYEEGGVQKMRTTWNLRDEFNWPDGTPLTAHDFVFTHELWSDPEQEIIDRTTTEKIASMVAKDDKTLVITWKERYAYYHNYRNHEAVPKHLVEPIYRRDGAGLKKHAFGTKPALAGSYTVKEWIPGSHVTVVKNPAAKGFLVPKIEQITWRIIPQTNTLEANLVSGSIDAIAPGWLTFDQGLELAKRLDKEQFDVEFSSGLVWEHIDFNLDNEILKDVRVRHSLAHGADRDTISKELFEGKQEVAHSTEPTRSSYHNPNTVKYEYNPDKARKLLEEAGWKLPEGKDIREKDGKKLKLEFMTTAGNRTREQVQVLLQSQWRRIGAEITIRNQPAKVFFGETLRHRKYGGMAMYAWVKDPVSLSDTLWRCDYIPRKENNFQGQNQPGYCNKEVDEILKAASMELDDAKRFEMGRKVEEYLAKDLPALPMFFRVDVSVTKKGLKNWKPTGTLQPVSWNAHEWSWN